MISVIFGKKGSGKTKKIIDLASQAVTNPNGDIVFIGDDNRYMYDLSHEVRFINASDFKLNDTRMLFGFLNGIIAGDFDVDLIFIDGFLKIVRTDLNQLESFFTDLNILSEKMNIKFVISVSGDPATTPDYIKQYLMH